MTVERARRIIGADETARRGSSDRTTRWERNMRAPQPPDMAIPIRGGRVLIAIAALAILITPVMAHAVLRQKPSSTFAADGPVTAIAPTPEAVYIGGDFDRLGRPTGPGVGIDATTGANAHLPAVTGKVHYDWAPADDQVDVDAVAGDGAGGFFIAGSFGHVGGVARSNLAHILNDGTVDPGFDPQVNGKVLALAVSGSMVYAGGAITSIDGHARNRVAAVDAVTGTVTGWDPNANGDVNALAVSGSEVYAGGYFTSIGGEPRNHIAALDQATGAATAWNPNINKRVSYLAVSGSTIYAAGGFRVVGGQSHLGLVALDATTATPPPSWQYTNHQLDSTLALAVSGSTLYVGGQGIAALDATTGATESLVAGAGGYVRDLFVSGSTIYAGGDFASIGGRARNGLAAIDASTGQATSWNPNPDGPTRALGASGSTVYAGGGFLMLGGVVRHNLAALDPDTGRPTSWNPNANSPVRDLVVDASTVYAGGYFTAIGGQARNRLAALDGATGAPTAWHPGVNGAYDHVETLAITPSTLYAGGRITSVDGQLRDNIVAINRTTGAVTAWQPGAMTGPGSFEPQVNALAVAGTDLLIGGVFSSVGGQPRDNLAVIDRTSGAITSWNPGALGTVWSLPKVYDLERVGSIVYAAGRFATIGGQARNNLAALDRTTGTARRWDPNPNDELFAIVPAGSVVYAGGAFTSIGGQPRANLAAVDPTSGRATGWNPQFAGTIEYVDGVLYAPFVGGLAMGPDGSLWVGGSFEGFGGVPQPGIARFEPVP